MVFDPALLNTPHYKVRIKAKVEESKKWSSVLPYTSVVAIEKEAFWSPLTMVAYLYGIMYFCLSKMIFKHLFDP